MDLTLHTLTGDAYRTFRVRPDAAALIGRSPTAEVCLPDERVSRRHATLLFRHPVWFVLDHGSAQGTFINGARVTPNTPTPVEPGDLIRIAGWTFRVFIGAVAPPVARTIDDTRDAAARVTSVGPARAQSHSARCLRLLSECMTTFNNAPDVRELADEVLKTALEGSGYARAAVLTRTGTDATPNAANANAPTAPSSLRPATEAGAGSGTAGGGGTSESVAVLASRRADPDDRAEFLFSGSLVRQAAAGQTALLSGSSTVATHSIADLSIHSALCAPFYLGDAVEGFLYLDARGSESAAHADAPVFCQAVARAYGLALSNLKRRELERRQAALQTELHAAREAQQFILPPLAADLGFVSYAMQMRPGLFVAGDLFDIIPLDDGRIAVCFGDVAGHGVGSAMLMAATQAHLNAQIRATGDPATALMSVNRYLADRISPGRFVTIWLGVFSPDGDLSYVDAGHGYWLVVNPQGSAAQPKPAALPSDATPSRAIPVGIFHDTRFIAKTIRLDPGSRVVLFSDGVVEERDGEGGEFGPERLAEAIRDSRDAASDVARIFTALDSFNGAPTFSDDASAASIHFAG